LIDEVLPKHLKRDLLNVKIVHRKKFFGFTNDKVFRFANVVFKSSKAWKAAYFGVRKMRKFYNKVYEANVDPILRFIHLTGIESTGWVQVKNHFENEPETSCDIEIQASRWKDVVPVQDDSIGPLVIASFDIETYSPDRSFPDPLSECPVIQIATTYQRYGTNEPFKRHLVTLKECEAIPNVDIDAVANEKRLLLKWARSIADADPDILVGYNIWKFDLNYIYKRAEKLGIEHQLNLNRYRDVPSVQYKAKFSSSAYGDNEYDMVTSKGRMQIDLLEVFKREHKLVKYSLNAVSEHFLGDKKVDMPIPEMFDRFESGTAEDMRLIGEYCVKDTELPLRLMNKLNNIANLIEMAKVTYVPMNYLIERGQQIKVFSQITKQTRLDEMLVVTLQDEKSNESFVGATVLNAKKGPYMDKVVTGLDFASLYPTIMRAHNLCYNTIVLDEAFGNLPDVNYEIIQWESDAGPREYKFAQNTQGILPKILENLAKSRKKAKKDMAAAKDDFMKSVYNGKQLAFKVSMNSIYGFCAAFMLPCQPISACVTTIGRNMIDKTKALVEDWYPGSEVIYGDSVLGDTPLLLKSQDSMLEIKRIDELFVTEGSEGTEKEYITPTQELFVWSDVGFTRIKHVMRHRTTKRIYRITTPFGYVDVTEDHSLLLEDGTETRPMDVRVGTKLLHAPFAQDPSDKGFDLVRVTEAHTMGMKYMEGHTDLVPACVFNSSADVIHGFFEGCMLAETARFETDGTVHFRCTNKTKAGVAGLLVVAQLSGYHTHMNTLNTVVCSKTTPVPCDVGITNIEILGVTTDYVYDLETENHHFHVGPGNLIVHNTDSVMVIFNTGDASGQQMLEKSFELGEEAAGRITETFKKPIELEFEKCYWPYLLFSKKRYAGLMYTNTEKPDYIDAKGIQLVRRDNAPFVKDISKTVLNMIMYDRAIFESIDFVQGKALELLAHKVPVEQLIVSKSMRKDYKNDKQPHLAVAAKQEARNPGAGPKCGERVPYLIMDTGNPKHLQFEKAEDPVYVVENNLHHKVDVLYYLEH
jgi:DNA polymerase elongation subunit (family B)